ncbi:unnamed protein product, partial [Prorocentrum cordatum]
EQVVSSIHGLVGNDKALGQAVEVAFQQLFASRPPPPTSVAKAPSLAAATRLKAAFFKQEQVGKKVERCCWELATAKHRVQEVQARLDALAEERLQATMEHEAAVAAVAGKGDSSTHVLPERFVFNLDPSIFADMGDAGEDYMAAVEAFQSARRAWLKEQDKAYNTLAERAELRERARLEKEVKFIQSQKAVTRIQSVDAARLPRMQQDLLGRAKLRQAARKWSLGAAQSPVPPTPVASEADSAGADADMGSKGANGPAAEAPVPETPPERKAQHLARIEFAREKAAKDHAEQLAAKASAEVPREAAWASVPLFQEVKARGPARLGPKGPSAFFARAERRETQSERYFGGYFDDCGVMAAVGTHLNDVKHMDAARNLSRSGWRAPGAAAESSAESSAGARGGELIA